MERSVVGEKLKENLAILGWHPTDVEWRDGLVPAERGSNLVVTLPPAPAWAAPTIAGALARPEPVDGMVLILASEATIPEWAITLAALTDGSGLGVEASGASRRAVRRLQDRSLSALVLAPEQALQLASRSALHPDRISTLVFAWPEDWSADSAIAALLPELPKDQQRVVLSSDPSRLQQADGLLERYVRRPSMSVGALPAPLEQGATVRSVATSWANRAARLTELVTLLDPAEPVVWVADARDRHLIGHHIGGTGTPLVREIPSRGPIVCYDPPRPDQLAALAAVGEVVLLVPPGAEAYLSRVAPERRPMPAESAVGARVREDEAMRQEVAATLRSTDLSGALYALGPLFETHDPQLVAASLLVRARSQQPVAPKTVTAPTPDSVRIWVGAGKRDEATVGDLVAVLVREVGVARELIGRIELRDTFSLVEVPKEMAERVVTGLTGITIRRRKVSARIDRGPGSGGNPHSSKAPGRFRGPR